MQFSALIDWQPSLTGLAYHPDGSGVSYTVTGALPAGLQLLTDPAEAGVINGFASQAGTFTFTVTAADYAGNSASATYTVTVDGYLTNFPLPAVLSVGEAWNPPPADVWQDYGQTSPVVPNSDPILSYSIVDGQPDPYAPSTVNGHLPPGMAFDPATGFISGAPDSSADPDPDGAGATAYAFAVKGTGSSHVSYSVPWTIYVTPP
jgi:hypothetical protein